MTWCAQSKQGQAAVVRCLQAGSNAAPITVGDAFGEAIKVLEKASETTKGYPKVYAEQCVIVEGCVDFPLEMLQHDRCAPAREEDALRMRRPLPFPADGGPRPFQRIELRRFVVGAKDAPHAARWLSFLWSVRWHGPPDQRLDALMKLDCEAVAKGGLRGRDDRPLLVR